MAPYMLESLLERIRNRQVGLLVYSETLRHSSYAMSSVKVELLYRYDPTVPGEAVAWPQCRNPRHTRVFLVNDSRV